jgi:hypothetical protein
MGTGGESTLKKRMDRWSRTIRVCGCYFKGTSVTLFKKADQAEAHRRRLDAVQPEKRRWRSTEIVNLREVRAQRTAATTRGRR